jgi:thiamine-phosphate pyrophosphorylase
VSGDERERVLRILDANRNRALEALRVVEEHARFFLAHDELARRTKDLRHQVHLALRDVRDLALHRDVAKDPLRPGAPASEPGLLGEAPRAARGTSEDVAFANLGRAKEALRALEEYAKPFYGEAAAALERTRYGIYSLEKDFLQRARTRERLARLYVLLEAKAGRPPLLAMARAALEGGARLFQWREKQMTDRARFEQGLELAALVRGEGGTLIVNDHVDVAAAIGAHGTHVGQDDLPADAARRILPPGSIVGSSAHDRPELERSLGQGVDYMGIGTVFASPTKPELGTKGLAVIAELAPRCPVPLYAIGGITAKNAASAIEAGASGVAVSSAVLDGVVIRDAVRELDAIVEKALAGRTGAPR